MSDAESKRIFQSQMLASYQAGDMANAERLCHELLKTHRDDAACWHILALVMHRQGRTHEAVECIDRAVAIEPQIAEYHGHRAEILRRAGRPAEAVEAARLALRLMPDYPAAQNNLGLALCDCGQFEGAEAVFRRVIAQHPEYVRGHHNLGQVLREQGRFEEAETSVRAALRLQPNYPEALNTLAVILHEQGQYRDALDAFQESLRLKPRFEKALLNLGNLYTDHDELGQAERVYRQALALNPNYPEALIGQAIVLRKRGRVAEAAALLEEAVGRCPESHETLLNLASCLEEMDRYDQAVDAFRRVLHLRANCEEALAGLAHSQAEMCDWQERSDLLERLRELIAARSAEGKRCPIGAASVHVFRFSAAEKLSIAEQESAELVERTKELRSETGLARPVHHADRLRVGYFSRDLRHHATGHLIRSLFGLHDRKRFEIFAYSYGPDDRSIYRSQIAEDCEHFVDVEGQSVTEIARRIADDEIDILVDLMGYAGKARPKVMALRPAPIQISYLGYPGTTGAPFVDYFITDCVATPPEQEEFFSESLVFMPHSYQVNDYNQVIAERTFTRSECDLPKEGLIFCAFNKNFKIEPMVFSIWMRILKQVPDSVLWLTETTHGARQNLKREAESHSVSAERLVFAPIVSKPEHLARHRLADMFLDTLICNGHTAASDALWAGLPVLTCPGDTFAARVAASLLTAVGLPELIMPEAAWYERRAVELAQDPQDLWRLRNKLADQRTLYPLFDTPRFTRNLEKAFLEMWAIHQAGRPPRNIIVEDLDPPARDFTGSSNRTNDG